MPAELRLPKQQPNQLLGAVKLLFGVAGDWAQFRAWACAEPTTTPASIAAISHTPPELS